MLLLTPVSLLFVLFFRTGSNGIASVDLPLQLYLLGAGVLTAVPALVYVSAINKLSFISMAFAQYLTPTFGMICGFLQRETMSGQTLFGFMFIWAGLLVYSTLTVIHEKNKMKEDMTCTNKSQESPPLHF
jgi:chloramphenicol-sensitive protein RarD